MAAKRRKAKRPKKPETVNRSQSAAFVAKAKELGCDDNPEVFKKALAKIAPPKRIRR
jgi:hypothetical protein